MVPPPARILRPPLPGPHWPGAGEALHLARGPRTGKSLVLSFDGGSSAEVADEILDTLKSRRVRTTLFLTGAFIKRYPELVRRMARDGHEIGNHTLSHPHFAPGGRRDPKWTREKVQRELLEADQALYALLGRPMDPYWRAPYGEQTAEIRMWAEEIGYRHVGWSEGADTLDWATTADRKLYRSGTSILDRLTRRLDKDGNGMIVLMHLGSARPEEDRPARSLGAFMDRAARGGWRFVPVGSYLKEMGKPEWDPLWRVAALNGATPLTGGQR
jgi:peptidoglycan/xylan/chitin deacetylase (PgdA/CDA1 family)